VIKLVANDQGQSRDPIVNRNIMSLILESNFEIRVAKETFKFNAAHFVAFKGFRERIHGHNYTVSVRLIGSKKIYSDGYVLDFGDVKGITRKVCKELNEHFLCPMYSDVMTILVQTDPCTNNKSVHITCEDGAVFVFPESDCSMLPIIHATTEELAVYLWGRIIHGLDPKILLERSVKSIEITIAEAPGQEAIFRQDVPEDYSDTNKVFDVRTYISGAHLAPTPCMSTTNNQSPPEQSARLESIIRGGVCCNKCASSLSVKLQAIANAINSGQLNSDKKSISGPLD